MSSYYLTKTEAETAILRAFRKQFSSLHFQSDFRLTKLDPEGYLGFNPINSEEFHGDGTYKMTGWCSVFGETFQGILKSYRCSFSVEVNIEKRDKEPFISFHSPIILKEER